MESGPHPPSTSARADSAVGLAFVGAVLLALFACGALGVLATAEAARRPAAPPKAPKATYPPVPVDLRERIFDRFRELVLLRQIALRERDPLLLGSVYAPGAPGLAADRAEIDRLRGAGQRLDDLRLPVRVFNAYRPGGGRWVVIARMRRSPARLVTDQGTPLRTVAGSVDVCRCTLVNRGGRWLLSRCT
jgi:hypothetical protein